MKKSEQTNSDKSVSEQKIWNNLRNGDVEALGELYDLFVDCLFSIGIQVVNDRSVVQDQLHELFLDLYKYHEKLSAVENVPGYLITSFKRKLYKQNNFKVTYLKQNWEENLEEVSPDLKITRSQEEILIQEENTKERSNFLKGQLSNLTEHQRHILKMKFTEEKSYEEIAVIMSLSVASARTLLYRTVKTLRKAALSIFF
tara:strand:+ start:6367 stop:6966 length:600 start_codon:yes stop_codon:yes gene_type:complete